MLKFSWILFFTLIVSTAQAQGNWTGVSAQPNYGTGRIDDISFINDSVGWTGQNGIIFKSNDGGEHWQVTDTFEMDAYIRSIEFINDTLGFVGTLLGSNPAHVYQTNDGGQSFFKIDSLMPIPLDGICGLAHIGGVIIGVGVYAEPAKFIRSTDYGQTWTVSDLSTYASGLVECQMLDSLTYLLGGIGLAPAKQAVILKTNDGGMTWQQVASSTANFTYTWKINVLQSGVVYASVENFGAASFFKSTDFGNTWLEYPIPLNQVYDIGAIGFINDSIGWVGIQHSYGMAKTTNGGANWTFVNAGLSVNRIIPLAEKRLLACGAVIYKNDFLISSGEDKTAASVKFHELKLSPNPSDKELQIRLNLIENTFITLELLDSKGLYLQTIHRGKMSQGKHQFLLKTQELTAGSYIILLRSNEGHLGKNFVVAHPGN